MDIISVYLISLCLQDLKEIGSILNYHQDNDLSTFQLYNNMLS